MNLTQKKCLPCEGGIEPLKADKITKYRRAIDSAWQAVNPESLTR